MKNLTLNSANGFPTPPCSHSHSKSTRFSLFTSLLLFFLLIVGSNAAWGWEVRGRGLTGLTVGSGTWAGDNNYVTMTDAGNNLYYAVFQNQAARSDNEYRYKICDGWKGTDYYDSSKGNVNLVSADETQISFTLPYASDVYIFYDSSTDKTWTIAVPVNASNYSGSNYIRQDLGLDASGWLNKDNGAVKLTSSSAYAKHVAAFVIPKGMQWRYEIYNGSGTKKVDKTTISASNSATRLAFVVWDGSSSSASVTLMPYVQKKSSWKLFVDDAEQGTVDSNGDYTVNNLSAASHTFYFTNGEGTTFHGVNYFGGCYVNTSVSSSLYSNHQYYKTSAVGTFTVPTIDTKGTGDNTNYYMFPKGKFTLSGGAKDVTFNFDGGVITINAVDHVESFTDEVYVYGAGGTNWVTGWSKPVEAYKMSISAGVASKTFYNVTGNGLNFKVWNKTKSSDIDWSDYSSSKSDVTCTNCSSNNICFDLGSNVYDVTVYTDGTEVWVKAKQHKSSLSGSYTVSGDFQGGWSNNGNQMLWTDDAKGYTYTIHNVSSNYTKNDHGWQRFKIFQYNTWTAECTANTATIIGLDGTVIGSVSDDKESDDGRIIVQVDEASDITFTYYQYTNGTKIVTIKRSAAAVTHTVTFNSNGGSAVASQNIEDGGTASEPSAPTKSGYTFVKWQLNSSDYNFSTPVTGNITLDAVWATLPAIHYDGTEYIFWSSHPVDPSWGTILVGTNATMWLRFKNTTTNAVSKTQHAAFLVEGSSADASPWGILAAKVPAGDWHQVQIVRVNANDSWNGSSDVWNEGNYFDLEDGKNYLPQRDWGGGRWSTYDLTNKASFFLSGTSNLTGVSDWTWNGNGTKYVASVTKTLAPETYQFKLTRDRTIYSSRGDYNSLQWVEAGNIDNFDSEHSNVTLDESEDKRISFTLSRTSIVTIAWENYDKITVNAVQYPRVTFKDGTTTLSFTDVEPSGKVSAPANPEKANYTFNYWKLEGGSSAFDFNTAITEDITLVADWTYAPAHVSSVSVSQASIYTWENDVTYTLVGSVDPADIDGATFTWDSDDHGVVTVENGVITVVGSGTANVTFTCTDYYGYSQSATCAVTVALCEKKVADAPKYSATIIGYNSSTGGSATLSGLWNQSSDNTEPATIHIVKLKLSNNYYIYDDNGTVKMSTDANLATAQWYEIPTGESYSPNWTGSSFALYEFKNVSTKGYLRRGDQNGGGGDWVYSTTITDSRATDGNKYKFFYDNTNATHLVCRDGVGTELQKSYMIHNANLLDGLISNYSAYCAAPIVPMGTITDPGGNTYTKLHETVVVNASYPNPNYVYSQMNTDYYRMKANATVTANCGALAQPDIIRVELYADSATSVKLTKTDGTEVCTIALVANEEKVFTYIVTTNSLLDGQTAFVIKAVDNHAAIRSVAVNSLVAKTPAEPEMHWNADLSGGVARLLLDGNFTYTAASNESSGTITYSAEGATVNATTGEVTPPVAAGDATISATITADECHAARTISYNVSFLGLQDYINEESVNSVTLPGDFTGENLVVNKELTINGGGHSIGNLTVENSGDLTLSGNLTVNDFTICAKTGNTTVNAASGQVRSADKLTVNGNAYFLYTVDPSGQVRFGWYDFTVPFPVNVMTGIKGIQNEVLKENFQNEVDYAIMEFLGDKLANGEYSYKKFRGIMQPNKLYSITLDDDYNYNTIRFQKTADGALVASNNVNLDEHASTLDGKYSNWNGVGNGTLHHADAGVSADYIQVYQSGDKTFLTVAKNQYSLVVGSAFMVKETGTMTLNQATHNDKLLAPKRDASVQPTVVQIAREGKPFSDQLFITADEQNQGIYTDGADLMKMGSLGSANVPQIWVNAYNSALCVHEAQLINGRAQYSLSLYAPANGTYSLMTQSVPENVTLYITQNGKAIWNLSQAETYTLELNKGTTTEYGLLIVESNKTPTDVENVSGEQVESTKVMRNGIMYIIRNGKVFNAQGKAVEK